MPSLKAKYQSKWRISNLRERFVYDYLNALLVPNGYILEYAGVGAGDQRLVSYYFRDVEEAFDFKIKELGGGTVGFLDVTGYADPRLAVKDAKRCIGVWKLYKAELVSKKLGLPLTRIWFAHFTDTKHILLLINAARLKELESKAEKRKLYRDEKEVICLDNKYWVPPGRFIAILSGETR